MLQPDRCRRRFAFDHQQLADTLGRKGGAQFEGRNQAFEAAGNVIQRRLVAFGEALNEAGFAQERLPAAVIVALQLRGEGEPLAAFLCSTLSWWRSVSTSASRETRDRKNPITIQQISLSMSPMEHSIAQFVALRQWDRV
jgi:hypothetical protein